VGGVYAQLGSATDATNAKLVQQQEKSRHFGGHQKLDEKQYVTDAA
jgi:hypothetical protein